MVLLSSASSPECSSTSIFCFSSGSFTTVSLFLASRKNPSTDTIEVARIKAGLDFKLLQ